MEMFLILRYPADDIRRMEEIVRFRDSFVTALEGETYHVSEYLFAGRSTKFQAILDRNVYTRVTRLVKGGPFKPAEIPDLQWAAAVLAFCQIGEIELDYASSLQEFAHSHGGARALEEMDRLQIADNSDPQLLIDFALGRISEIPLDAWYKPSVAVTERPAEDFEQEVGYFRINYTVILKVAQLSKLAIPAVEKMIRLIDWMYSDFMFGAPALLFASRYFSPNPHRKMIKSLAKADLENAAWDLTMVQWWQRILLTSPANVETILISGDKALRDMARRMIAESEEVQLERMREVWGRNTPDGARVQAHYDKMWGKAASAPAGERRNPDYAAQWEILRGLELELGI